MADDYEIKDIYQGGYDSLKPSYGESFTGVRVSAGKLGAPTSAQTANQIKDINKLLNQGIIPIEIGTVQPEVFDQIPKQHFREMKRMAKLTGAEISVHAPIQGIEPSGIDPEERRPWDESHRKMTEKQLKSVVDRAIEVDEDGKVPITIHSSNLPGSEYKIDEKGNKVRDKVVLINQETGKFVPLEPEIKYNPTQKNLEEESSFEEQRKKLNDTEWDNSISVAMFNQENAEKILEPIYPYIRKIYPAIMNSPKLFENLPQQDKDMIARARNAKEYMIQSESAANTLFSKAYKYGTKEQQEELKKLAKEYRENLGIKEKGKKYSQEEVDKINDLKNQSRTINSLLNGLKGFTPEMYIPIEEFAQEKSAQTFANVALHGYKKYGDKAPVINVENMFPGMAFYTGEEMSNLIKESRKQFVKEAIDSGITKSQARKKADELIGITFDVGHLNIGKKKGFKDEDLRKEAEQIARHVKHVHLTDNFGYSDSHLPPGMGNVPIKKHLEELEKAGRLKDIRKIVEAPAWFQHFESSPLPQTLRGMGPPMYSTGEGPYWNQAAGLQQDYLSGYGNINPGIHHQTFGAGFSQLPVELGGQMPGAQGSRVSGNPME